MSDIYQDISYIYINEPCLHILILTEWNSWKISDFKNLIFVARIEWVKSDFVILDYIYYVSKKCNYDMSMSVCTCICENRN